MTIGTCPDCRWSGQEISGSVHTCSNPSGCELVAPSSAFTTTAASSNQAPRAWTISGSVD